MAQTVKNPPANAGDLGSIPGWERSSGEGNGYPLQHSCLENPVDREALWATVHGVTKSRTRPSDQAQCTPLGVRLFLFLSNSELGEGPSHRVCSQWFKLSFTEWVQFRHGLHEKEAFSQVACPHCPALPWRASCSEGSLL